MSATSCFLDVQTLAQLTCERSKQWASFMENYSQDAEEGLELDMDELEEVFDDLNYEKLAEEENDDIDDEEEAIECEEDSEDDDAVMDITNCTIIKCENMDNNEQQQNQFALVDKHGNIEKNKKFQDFLNQTLNIFSEHQRQLRESGVDRMLQTFDAQKIEATLGGYLERHNKTLDLSYSIPYKLFTKSHFPKHHHCSKQPLVSYSKSKCNESDSESMHSIDTAQYIRSSRRQQRISQKNPASATTTMTIKTFRMVKSKRDALKQKYACAEYDEDHLEEVKMRRRQRKFEEVHSYRECHNNSAAAYYHQQKKQQRRKQLRKRRSTCSQSYSSSDMSSDTSSDYDSYADSPYNCHTHAISGSSVKRRMSSHKPKCHGRHCACGMQATPSQSRHIVQNYKMPPESHRKRKQHNISGELMDPRPCRRESECPCKNQRTLCRSYRHVVNSSSEDWFVENCLTPKSNKINSAKLELLTAIRAQPMNDFHKSLKPRKINVNKQEEPSFKLSESSDDDDDGRNQPKSSRKKENCRKRKVKKEAMETIEIFDDGPDYRKSVKRNARKKVSLKDNNKSLEKSNDLDDSLFKAELEKAIIESKALYEQQNKKTLNNDNDTMTPKNDIHRTKKRLDQLARTLKPQPKTAKLRKLLELSGNSSFLANTNNIYNSTAVANNSTMNGKRIGNALKSSAFSLSNCEEENTSAHKTKDSDNDCTIVTSTTDAVNSSSNYHANKGILIYKPNQESGGDGARCSQSYFNVTQEHLAAVIGAKSASKFLKYYVGRRRFNSSSTIYYRPPEPQLNVPVSSSASSSQLAKADSNGQSPDSSVSEEDDDILERVNQYGELYESVRKSN